LIRSKAGDVDKRLHVLIPCRRDHGSIVGVPTRTAGPETRSSVRSTAPVSSANEVRGSGAASTRTVWAASGPMTLAQLDPSASSVHQNDAHILMRHWFSPHAAAIN
jgi:hypothetical protein